MHDFVWEYIGNQRGVTNQSALQQKKFVNPSSDTSELDIKSESESERASDKPTDAEANSSQSTDVWHSQESEVMMAVQPKNAKHTYVTLGVKISTYNLLRLLLLLMLMLIHLNLWYDLKKLL